jgi:hypothetical protein
LIPVIASAILGFMTHLPAVQTGKVADSYSTHPVFVNVPRTSNGLTLYNEKGEVVARCQKENDSYGDCKMEPGVSLDDLMNAWVHAYLDAQK